MQCRKVIRTQSFGNNKNLVQSEIIIGINDYIPPELKKRNKLDILIEGDITIAIFRLLWNEYYCKTLLKEMWMAYLGESPQDLPCENKKTSGMFAKIGSNIYNLSQIIDINPVACKAQENIAESLQLTLEAFAPNGSTKKYSITISEGHAKKEYDVILKIIKNC